MALSRRESHSCWRRVRHGDSKVVSLLFWTFQNVLGVLYDQSQACCTLCPIALIFHFSQASPVADTLLLILYGLSHDEILFLAEVHDLSWAHVRHSDAPRNLLLNHALCVEVFRHDLAY